MSKWKECKLGEVADVQTGPFGSQLHQRDYVNIGTPIITVEHLGDNRILHSNLPLVSDIDKERLKKYILKKGDIVFSRVGSVDRRAYVSDFENGWLFSGRCLRVRCNDNLVSSKYLSYYFGQESFKEYIRMIAVGATMPSINTDILKMVDIVIPPLPEQKAIAAVLSSLDDKIDLLHRNNKTLEAMAETIFRQSFVKGTEDKRERKKLGFFLKETIGGDWGKEKNDSNLKPVYCLRGIDLDHIKKFSFSANTPIRYVKENSLNKRMLKETDILIGGSGLGPIGKSIPITKKLLACYQMPVIYSNFCKRLRAETKYHAYFFEFFISYLYKKGELEQFYTGTSIPNFDIKDFLNYEILAPTEENIINFGQFLDSWYKKKFNGQILQLEKLRDTLIPKLISGEIRVKM